MFPKFVVEALIEIVLAVACAAAITALLMVMAAMARGHIGWWPTFPIVFVAIYVGVLIPKFGLC